MSAAQRDVDLSALARERAAPESLPRPRRWLRIALPLALVLGFAALLATSALDLLRGVREVAVVRPVPVREGARGASAGEVVAQAAGWVEPDPLPVLATALTTGVVRELLVQESDAVEAGAPLARLIDDDARLELASAEGHAARAAGELARAEAELVAARESFEAALAPTEALRVAEAELAGRREAAAKRAEAARAGVARVDVEAAELEVQRALEAAGAAGTRQVELAAARAEEARGLLAALEAEAAVAVAEVAAAEARRERARADLELRIEDRLRIAAAEAAVAAASGGLGEARAHLAAAALALERTTVRAPSAGVVLARTATIGSPVGPAGPPLVSLYDPRALRVRVDVPQQDLSQLEVGQAVRIESDARRGRPYAGEVLRVVRQADIQKVTLQAHVRVLDGDELLRPEMLVQARFLAAASGAAPDAAGSAVAIPARLLEGGDRVWVLEPERGTAALRSVRAGARDGDLVVIESGLNLSDKLLDPGGDPLREGERVREARR